MVDLIDGCHKYRSRATQSELLKMSLNIFEVGLITKQNFSVCLKSNQAVNFKRLHVLSLDLFFKQHCTDTLTLSTELTKVFLCQCKSV